MGSFKNRFWGVKRLHTSQGQADSAEERCRLVAPYLDWRVLALDHNAILLCRDMSNLSATQVEDMVIIEGSLLETWLQNRKTGV